MLARQSSQMVWVHVASKCLGAPAGAATELGWAYKINPFNPEEIADSLYKALEDPPEGKAARMASMRHWVREHNIFFWAARILEDLIRGVGQE